MDSPPNLTTLPNEIIAMIASVNEDYCLEKEDLIALRLTCNRLHGATYLEFAKRYFTDPFFMATRYSLQTFLAICKHPIFGPTIRTVRFYTYRSSPENLTHIANQLENHDTSSPPLEVKMPLVELQPIQNLYTQELRGVTDGEIHELLKTAFECLVSYGNPVELSLQNSSPSRWHSPIGYSWTPSYVKQSMKDCMDSAFGLLIDAAFASSLNIETLSITYDQEDLNEGERYPPRPPEGQGFNARSINQAAFSNLKNLHIETDFALGETFACSLEYMISQANHLEAFQYGTHVDWGEPDDLELEFASRVDRVVRSIASDSFQQFRLHGSGVSEGALVSLMMDHQKTLRTMMLRFQNIHNGSWKSVLEHIRKLPALQSLQLYHLSTFSHPNTGKDIWEKCHWANQKIKGKCQEDIHSILNKLLRDIED